MKKSPGLDVFTGKSRHSPKIIKEEETLQNSFYEVTFYAARKRSLLEKKTTDQHP